MTELYDPLVTRLSGALHRRDPDLSSAARWSYGHVTGPMARLAGGSGHDAYLAAAITTQAFAIWHAGKTTTHYGKTGSSLGRALRQVGTVGNYGPRDPKANRLFDQLLAANTGAQLHRAVTTAFTAMKGVDHPPHWGLLHDHLVAWFTPATRNDTRLAWGQDFSTSTPTTN